MENLNIEDLKILKDLVDKEKKSIHKAAIHDKELRDKEIDLDFVRIKLDIQSNRLKEEIAKNDSL